MKRIDVIVVNVGAAGLLCAIAEKGVEPIFDLSPGYPIRPIIAASCGETAPTDFLGLVGTLL